LGNIIKNAQRKTINPEPFSYIAACTPYGTSEVTSKKCCTTTKADTGKRGGRYLDTNNCCKDEIILWCFPIGQILLIGWNLRLLNWTVGKSYTPQSKSCHSLNDFSPFCNLLERGGHNIKSILYSK
jgi:hypothetical protein